LPRPAEQGGKRKTKEKFENFILLTRGEWLEEPKSGRDQETGFIPEAERLKAYLDSQDILPDKRLLSVCYSTARSSIKKI
jgi:hypothetical protein